MLAVRPTYIFIYNTNSGQTSVINMLAVRPTYIFIYNTNSGQTSVTNIWAVTEGRGECSQNAWPLHLSA